MNDVDDDLICSKNIAETLETIVKSPFATKDLKPLSQLNFDYLRKWISNLEDMREELQTLWKSHEKYLTDATALCQFERDFSEVFS